MTEEQMVERIKEVVSKYFNISVKQINSRSRKGSVPYARFIIWHILYIYLAFSANRTKKYFSVKDHTSILHGRNKTLNDQVLMMHSNRIAIELKKLKIIPDDELKTIINPIQQQRIIDLENRVKSLEIKNKKLSEKLIEVNQEITRYKEILHKYRTTSQYVQKIAS